MSSDSTSNPKSQYQVPAQHAKKWAWLRRILASKSLSASAKNLATALMSHHNEDDGQCNPKQVTLATGLGVGRSYVNQLVAELEDAGWIAVQRTRGASLYRLEIDHAEAAPGSGEMSANDNIRCSQPQTSDVDNREHLDVRNREHRTKQGNLKEERQKLTSTAATSDGPATDRNRKPAEAVVSEAMPEFETFHGLSVPVAEIKRWQGLFPLTNVRRTINERARWAMTLPDNNGRRLKAVETVLANEDKKLETAQRDRNAKAEAEARHKAKPARAAI